MKSDVGDSTDLPVAGDAPDKPSLRGVSHQIGAVVALIAGTILTATAPTMRGAVSAGMFTFSLVTLYTVSATYHRVHWQPKARAIMRRADHASIFILIAGTYTPIAVSVLPPEFGTRIMAMVWAGAMIGVLQSLFWISAPKAVAAVIAVALGWSVLLFWREAATALLPTEMALIFAGGVFYTAGALCYAFKRPNPWPKVFGYHEFFHAFTILAAVLHFIGIASMVGRAV